MKIRKTEIRGQVAKQRSYEWCAPVGTRRDEAQVMERLRQPATASHLGD